MLEFPGSWLDTFRTPLAAMTGLIGTAVVLGCLNVAIFWWIYRWSLQQAIQNEACLRRALFSKYHDLAAAQGVSGQQKTQNTAISSWIPQIRDGILHWYRNIPRHPLLCVACIVPALLIHTPLTILCIVSIILLWRANALLDQKSRSRRPIFFDRSQSIQKSIEDLMIHGPLLASVQPVNSNLESFDTHVRNLNEIEQAIGNSYIWKRPVMAGILIPAVGVLCWIISVRILDRQGTLNVSGASVLAVLVAISTVSLLRTIRSIARQKTAALASQKLLAVLDQPMAVHSHPHKPVTGLSNELALEHVTLKDSNGSKLLEDISATFRPGQLTAVLSTSRQDAESMGELLLGFGSPISGRILWDGTLSADLSAKELRSRCIWVAANGPLLSGTIRENLTVHVRAMPEDLVTALKKSGSYESIFELPESIDTLVSASDDRFKGDTAFRIGIARAILAKASLCVAYEPSGPVKPTDESQTLESLKQLTSQNTAVVVLAQRMITLREADQIIVLHQHRVAAIGKHGDLLENSDLYRHLNYTMFSPLRQIHLDS
jgi:ABC-type multidrug transport system fused ATPase/permease subunit